MLNNNTKFKVLIVDDVPKNIQVLGNILMRNNYNISFASNGNDAIRLATENELDLILLDVMMPGIDGFETCKQLKANEKTAEIPIIFMTALTETADKVKGFSVGAVDYITKPYEAEEVLARVETHLTIRKLKKDLEKQISELEIRNNFIRRTFGRYLSEEIVSNLLESPDGLQVGGENLNVTILMCDIRGFSSVTENLEPKQVVKMLNIYLSSMTDVIIKYEGTIDEFIGDGILVIFGAPIWQENHAERAVACALEMQQAMDKMNEELTEKNYPRLKIGIGINTGEVVVGNIGSQKRAKYGVVGRNVNIASRIESYTIGRQILISENTRKSINSQLKIVKEIKVNPKGVRKPILLSDVVGISGEYNVELPVVEEVLKPLTTKIECNYIVLDEKSADHIAQPGKITRYCGTKAELQLQDKTPVFSNFKLIFKSGDNNIDVYAKSIEKSDEINKYIISFTHLPEEAVNLFKNYKN